MSDLTRDQVIDYLSQMPITELSALIHDLEGKWGVSATPVSLPSTTPDTQRSAPTGEPEQTEFDVMVTAVAQDKKIQAIKVLRDATGLGLKEAKDSVDNVASKPALAKQGVSKADAEDLRQKLEAAGCTVKLV
jgi:large subunit ribosomal protein L7/L12